ncbi:hypothetical protein SBOR_4881 [Sclerotinia borealis F-4128]|uniref:Uncharacterized protein n=1 Tax=Sclerotinia borealis (strain F-4128) TaxID=1432307 RepID=W9CJB7_SCLBF|nr:hypothetical protein SBOR_4881 [Sclerotinia borealis F-4128]
MSQVKQEEVKGNTALSDPKITKAMEATINTATEKTKSSKDIMSLKYKRMAKLGRGVFGARNAQVKKDKKNNDKNNNNKVRKTSRRCTSVASLGRKSQRGKALPFVDFPAAEALLHLNDDEKESYKALWDWSMPIQNMKKTMTWKAILAVYAKIFPNEKLMTSPNSLANRYSNYFARLSFLLEKEQEASALKDAVENSEFVFPDDEEEDEDEEMDEEDDEEEIDEEDEDDEDDEDEDDEDDEEDEDDEDDEEDDEDDEEDDNEY